LGREDLLEKLINDKKKFNKREMIKSKAKQERSPYKGKGKKRVKPGSKKFRG